MKHSIDAMKTGVATLAAVLGAAICASAANSKLEQFITVKDGQLLEGGEPFRFISFDVPNLLEIEDNVRFGQENPWRLPDRFEISDALETVREAGGTIARTYVITVERTNDPPGTHRHVLGPGRFDEESFRTLDEVLAEANRAGVRLIIPLVDNWPWMGGRAQYAGFRGKSRDSFWSDPQLIGDFEQTIQYVLTRTNTVTGTRYCEDKAILCWETGNELQSPAAWTRQVARYIKSVDTNHLVMDGFNTAVLREESLEMPEVDVVTTHHYPGGGKGFAQLIRENAGRAKGKKAYIIGEFGFVSTAEMQAAMEAIAESGASGGLLWSLRFRNREGGFYWHSEPYGDNLYKAFHWPGSALGDPYDERALLKLVRSKAFAIRGMAAPEIAIPAAPRLLPIADAAAISWQGSVGAASYQVERAAKVSGPWQIIAANVDEAFTQYRPQFADETVPAGKWYYRVRARNESGLSEASNIVGPVEARTATLVDELADLSKVNGQRGEWKIVNRDCRSALEDAHRAAGAGGAALIYRVPAAIEGFRVIAFFPKAESEVRFSVSDDGKEFREVAAQREFYYHGAGEYGYWKAVLFHAEKVGAGRYFEIQVSGETQIGRVEISHPALSD